MNLIEIADDIKVRNSNNCISICKDAFSVCVATGHLFVLNNTTSHLSLEGQLDHPRIIV
jgi:hypothetical protein